MSEFQPTEINAADLRTDLISLKESKALVVGSKMRYDRRLGEIKELLETRISNDERMTLKLERKDIKVKLANVELRIREINKERNRKNKLLIAIEEHLTTDKKLSESAGKLLVKIQVLKKHYQHFASEHSRVASTRRMASEFVLKLEEIENSV